MFMMFDVIIAVGVSFTVVCIFDEPLLSCFHLKMTVAFKMDTKEKEWK